MNRVEIKKRAKDLMHEKLKDFWLGYLIVMGISLLGSLAISILTKEGSILYNTLTIVFGFFTSTLSVGFYSYILKIIRKEEYKREDVFAYISDIGPIVVLSILMTLIIFLWSLLLIIPGIIAAVGYSLALYVYVDNKDLSPMEILNKSKEMMNGYKWDYVVFELSFLGWIILGGLTLGILYIWVIPYMTYAQTIYYEELKKLKEKK